MQNFVKRKGLDLRGDGGYVILPPSKHPSGIRYEWILTPKEEELADPPGWLLELITKKEPGKKLPETELSRLLDGVITGKRHDTATRLAGHYIGKGLASSEVIKLLKLWNDKNKPPLPENELTRMVGDFSKAKIEFEKRKKEETKKKYHFDKIILNAQEFIKVETPEKKTILSPWLKEKQIILISGWRGVGKTWLALSLLDSITRKKSFGSWKAKTPVNCLYLDAEMVKQDLDERLLTLNPAGERQSQLSIYSSELANTQGEPGPCLFDLTWQALFKEFLIENEISLWVADNITSLTPGLDENAKSEWDSVNEWLKELRWAGITTILIHHLGKGGTQRGTSAREDNIDISIQLNHPPGYLDTDGCKFELKFTKTRLRHRELKDISDLQLQLREDEEGRSTWTCGSIKKSIRNQVLTLFDEGTLNQSEIAEELKISRQHVSKIKKEGSREKLITPEGKLTQTGFMETGKI
ncbi:hypothetical protein ES703_30207 [subsurface metagenome]